MNKEKHKELLLGLAFFLFVGYLLTRSSFYNASDKGFLESIFLTKIIYEAGEQQKFGALGALSYIRSLLTIIFPATFIIAWTNPAKTRIISISLIAFSLTKIAMDYFVISSLINRGSFSTVKFIITIFVLLCIYEGCKQITKQKDPGTEKSTVDVDKETL